MAKIFQRKLPSGKLSAYWYGSWFVGPRRVTRRLSKNRAAAKRMLAAILTDIERGQYLDPRTPGRGMTLAKYVDEIYLPWVKENRSPLTLSTYRDVLRHALEVQILPGKPFGGMRMDRITLAQLEIVKAKLRATRPGSVRQSIVTLRTAWHRAIRWHYVYLNPAAELDLPKPSGGRVRYLELDEIDRVIDKAAGWLKPVLIISFNTGARKTGVLTLKRSDVDKKLNQIHVAGKGGYVYHVPMNGKVRAAVDALIQRADTELLFPPVRSKKNNRSVDYAFGEACRKAGIVDFRWHDMRHTFASQLVIHGVSIDRVSKLMGHKSILMTMKYAHLSPQTLQDAVNVLG